MRLVCLLIEDAERIVDLDSLWADQFDFGNSTSEEAAFKKQFPEMVRQFLLVFKSKMAPLLDSLRRSIVPNNGSSAELSRFRELDSTLSSVLDQISKDPSCVKSQFTLKYGQENLILLSDLLNKNLFQVERVYQSYAKDLSNVLTQAISHFGQITPDSYSPEKLNCKPVASSQNKKVRRNNYLSTSTTHPVNSLSNGEMLLTGDSLKMFKEGHLPSLRSIFEFVLGPLRKSLSKYSNDFILLRPLFEDMLLSHSVIGSSAWDSLVLPHQREQLKTRENFVIPLLSKDGGQIGSVAFICRQKRKESIEIYSPSEQGNLHLKNSSFYFLR